MEEEQKKDQELFKNAIKYFQRVTYNNIHVESKYNVGATFIGIKTNITGTNKLHIYILLFPFVRDEPFEPYSDFTDKNIYLTDISFSVDKSFYEWMFSVMERQTSIVMMKINLDDFSLQVVTSDLLIKKIKDNKDNNELYNLSFEEWYEKGIFNDLFTIEITNPFLYLVPFPVKPIFFTAHTKSNKFLHKVVKNV